MAVKTYSGTVLKGNERGRALGYPTANIALHEKGLSGVYAGRVSFEDHEHIAAIFVDEKRKLLEAYLIGYEGILYDKHIRVEIHMKIRDSQNFASDDSLKAAIREDVQKVRAYFE